MINIFCDKCIGNKNAKIRIIVQGNNEILIKCLECGDTKTLINEFKSRE